MKIVLQVVVFLIITTAMVVANEQGLVSSTKKNQADKPTTLKQQKGTPDNNLNDTLIVKARLIEIPGKFPPNDLYNYVYIMKYQVISIEKGNYANKEILVGQYNPLLSRTQVKDKMDKYVDGNVTKFETGSIHRLVLIRHIDSVWKDAIEDNYFDLDLDKYYALKTDLAS